MELNEILKNLKRIQPDEAYSRSSRETILSVMPKEERFSLNPWRVVTHSFQFSSAIALATFLILLGVGGFSAWRMLSPLRTGSLDPMSLRAEAEAIDTQLHLTDITYAAGTEIKATDPKVEQQAATLGIPSSSKEASIEVALDLLAE